MTCKSRHFAKMGNLLHSDLDLAFNGRNPPNVVLRHHAEGTPYRGENNGPGEDDHGELDTISAA
jgi:hypothetical protein